MPVLEQVRIATGTVESAALPTGLQLDPHLGLACVPGLSGQVVHNARDPEKGLFESRGARMANGDYLLMFPDGNHYGRTHEKDNDMLAYRSRDRGRTWEGPQLAFDINYSQHGFIPLCPAGSERVYAFGTQPIPGMWTRERGLQENAPIGFRYSDDHGHAWSEVRLIRPANDPGFRGMSVMRMTETARGTWLVGSHEGDWSYNPLITRQYVLRSEDRGDTWDLLPGVRHGGWHAPPMGRMDEGRPLAAEGDEVYLLARTPTGRLWDLRSRDDGRTWSDPKPTSMVHPDAPPMLFPLSDGGTWVSIHHNVHTQGRYVGLAGTMDGMYDRGQLWASLSTDWGRSWSEPGFLCTMARQTDLGSPFRNYQSSYVDGFADEGVLNLFMSQSWQRVLHMQIRESELNHLPMKRDLGV